MAEVKKNLPSSIYEFTIKDLENRDVELSKYDNNQVLLIMNFATNDDLADKNFLELRDLKQRYPDGKNY
ncbi:CLUMA_CG002865, isoform A [Clunio marinus]|uniref:CLUMA_CG002865, isoform A n=1 Tax=Clunio marinus TaxID=568069 RepID=A0A1J1HN52_9DIPT|nr:CLUMA_CG002865, isoform A [Clunio marinus]